MLNEYAQLVVNLIGIGYFCITFIFLSFLMRAVTKRRWLIQMITIKLGVYEYETISVKELGDKFYGEGNNKKHIKESQLYRDNRPKKFWIWYWVSNCRGKYITVLGEDGEPIEFKEPEVTGDIVRIARKSTALTEAINTTFDKGNPNGRTIIIILILVIVIIAMVALIKYANLIDFSQVKL